MASRTRVDPRLPTERRILRRSVLEALRAMSEAATFALLEAHPQLSLRVRERHHGPPRDVDEEAQRLLDLLEQIHDAADRYVLQADPDDDLPF